MNVADFWSHERALVIAKLDANARELARARRSMDIDRVRSLNARARDLNAQLERIERKRRDAAEM